MPGTLVVWGAHSQPGGSIRPLCRREGRAGEIPLGLTPCLGDRVTILDFQFKSGMVPAVQVELAPLNTGEKGTWGGLGAGT